LNNEFLIKTYDNKIKKLLPFGHSVTVGKREWFLSSAPQVSIIGNIEEDVTLYAYNSSSNLKDCYSGALENLKRDTFYYKSSVIKDGDELNVFLQFQLIAKLQTEGKSFFLHHIENLFDLVDFYVKQFNDQKKCLYHLLNNDIQELQLVFKASSPNTKGSS